MVERANWADVLRACAYLLEHPEEWEGFKAKFGDATAKAAIKLAEQRGVPAEVLAKMKAGLGVD